MKIDRLIGILTYLLQHDKTTAPKLAQKFEVSRRTILRDIDALSLAGFPILTTQGGDGGISIMDGYKFDKSILTVQELSDIIIGLKSIESISDTSGIKRLIQKLSPQNTVVSLHDHIVIDLSSYYKDSLSLKIEILKEAISEQNIITFEYYYHKGQSIRKVEPYFIRFSWGNWYIFGWCQERKDFRLFKLNRLWDLKITAEHFAVRDITKDEHCEDFSSAAKNKVKLLFDKSVRFRLIDEYGLNCYTETDDGLFLDVDYTNYEYITSWILSFGENVIVLEPMDFRQQIIQTVLKTSEKYLQT